ncbi:hypothetical protein LAZ67_4001479 [Cordylochernes scorpioides]|uniref:Reverse transcriptase domain-containing protein n=1 Tax=Cordylochernes scorpioides TaxID=51811 RepID=A0ABY6KBY2_9ARAC|nr:hypothetical protein LAZ67_4001479 [Cordylochernes scorpioides]
MDLRSGYWQIEVDEKDREKTAFITPDGLYEFRVMLSITSELPNFFIEKDNWPYLKNILLADPNFDKSSQIDLVIGAELAPCLFNGKVRLQNLSGPTVCGSKLGWLLTGKILLSGENSNQDITMFASEEQDDFLKKFWELESVPSAKSLTREEILCEEIYINNLKILEDGRYSVGLPFRILPTLGESRINALKRFLSLERKLQKSPSILKQYCDFMDEYLLINHMELIPSDELDIHLHIPHHCFDASCKTSNSKSLNYFLHVGPKLQQDIFNILIRFRTRPIAFSGDIEKMYRQVRIDSRDCDFQIILWRKKPSEPLLDYRLLTVTYGLSCVPYLAMRTLHQLARDKVSTFPVASKIVQTDFYVDDLLSGADTIEEATCHIREVNNLLSSAGFSLRKSSKKTSRSKRLAIGYALKMATLGNQSKTIHLFIRFVCDSSIFLAPPYELLSGNFQVFARARPLNSMLLKIAKKEFQYMLDNHIIRPSRSPPCGDYRKLNSVTIPDKYPIPKLEDFNHILKKTHREKTAVITPLGLFEFEVMSFGLCGSPETFQRFINEVLLGLDFVFPYLDDILVVSKSEEEHEYPEIARLEDMTSASVIVHCKSIFARHGIPLEVQSDNGPQFVSLFKETKHGGSGVRELPPLDVNDRVWLTDLKTPRVIIAKADTPKSYMVDTLRARRRAIYPEANTHTSDAPTDVTDSSTSPKEALYRTRSGRIVGPPRHFGDD